MTVAEPLARPVAGERAAPDGPQIHVVHANPAMDRIEVLDRLEVDAVNRSIEVYPTPGGKGLNVARGIRQLGGEVAAYGFVGGLVGRFLRTACAELGIEDRHVEIDGETRICVVLVERESGRSTVVNEPGPSVGEAPAARLLRDIERACRPGDLVVMSGSLPAGIPESYYADLVTAVQAAGARAIVDTAGPVLRAAMERGPWMVKPNVNELGEALERPFLDDDRAILSAMAAQVDRGTEIVCVTLGSRGALAIVGTERWRIRVPRIQPVNATGSGDLLLAGFATALSRGRSPIDALRFGAACGVANAMHLMAELPAGVDLDALAQSVVVEPI